MRYKLIACKALTRELSYAAALSKNNIDITFLRQGYHNTPDVLRTVLQQEVDAVETGRDPHTNELGGNGQTLYSFDEKDFDAILIGYGLCSNGIVGLHSRRHTLVIPRGHDCITFFLGSKERYKEYFQRLPGCFWYTASWLENADVGGGEATERQMRRHYLAEGYDEDTVDFLLESLNGWTKQYRHGAYIRMPFYDSPLSRQQAQDASEYYKWDFTLVDGDMSLLNRFLAGDWDPEDFLVVPPGFEVVASHDERILSCAPSGEFTRKPSQNA